jgi:dihydrofolate reductase
MIISAIVAMSENRVIGKNNKLPWHVPADLKHFKTTTLGKPIVMGRKTFASIGRPLPDRTNVILTHDTTFTAPGCEVFLNIDSALGSLKEHEEIIIIGGSTVYAQMLPHLTRLYLTLIHDHIKGDTVFPELNMEEWAEVDRKNHKADVKHAHDYSFLTLERK